MELKRYFMVEEGRIFDLSTQLCLGNGEGNSQSYMGYEMKIGGDFTTSAYGKVIKTSDNILDLVEVGDLVRACDDVVTYELLAIENNYVGINAIKTKLYVCRDDEYYAEDIKYIYKKQPNGDYKRYSV